MKTETTSRVYKIDDSLRNRMKETRTSQDLRTTELVALAVQAELPALVVALQEIGFSPEGPTRPIKFELSDEVLHDLREASEHTGLPSTLLLKLSLLRACPEAKTAPKKASPKKAAPKTAKKAPAKKKATKATPKPTRIAR